MTENIIQCNCPLCHKEDSIQRIPAIVSSGTVSGTFSGPSGGVTRVGKEWGTYSGYTTLSGTQMSHLAALLVPPSEPKMPIVISKDRVRNMNAVGCLGSIFVFPLAMVIIYYIIFFFIEPVMGDVTVERAKHERRLAQWNLAKGYWSTLYYCHRDGIVFDPVSKETCQPENVMWFVLAKYPINWNYIKKFVFRVPVEES